MANTARFLPRLDGSKLAAFRQHCIYSERPALHFDAFSDVYPDGFGGETFMVGECFVYRLVAAFSVAFYNAVHARLVGFLIV
jgi:hypothetical protein